MFNPTLPVMLASPPRADAFWFPDSELWTDAAAHAGTAAYPSEDEFIAARLSANPD
jgi:hypothetical protein